MGFVRNTDRPETAPMQIRVPTDSVRARLELNLTQPSPGYTGCPVAGLLGRDIASLCVNLTAQDQQFWDLASHTQVPQNMQSGRLWKPSGQRPATK